MIIRRYYNRQRRYPYTFHPEVKTWHELIDMAGKNPDVDFEGLDNAEYEFILSSDEQDAWWGETMQRVMLNTRYVLDNLDSFFVYNVRWNHNGYCDRKISVGLHPKSVSVRCEKLYNQIKQKAL